MSGISNNINTPPVYVASLEAEQEAFESSLNNWVAEGGGNREEAARRIRAAKQNASDSLNLSRLRLTSLPAVIGELAQLQRLYLSRNQLQALPDRIGELAQLQQLDLSENQLQDLPDGIGELAQLQELYLSDNQLEALPDWIGELTQLQALNLSGNQLQALPDGIGELAQLQVLYFSHNQLQALPDWIGELAQLQALNLSGNQLQDLPDWIGELAQLQELDLSHNQLQDLPNWIGELAQLQVLNLSDNQLQALPDRIGELAQLQWLDLSYNQLEDLPDGIGELAQLQRLNLSDNHLQALPAVIGELTQLQALILSHNQLQALPDWIGELAQLQELYLSDNQLEALPNWIGELAQLQELYLSDNQLEALPDGIGELAQLQVLNLSGNQLQALPDWIGELAQLRRLNLSYNRLQDLPDWIGELAQLQRLNLSGNQLQALPDRILAWMLGVRRVTGVELEPAPPVESVVTEFTTLFPGASVVDLNALKNKLESLDEIDQARLSKLMTDLSRMEDYQNPETRPNLIFRAHQLLKGFTESETFLSETLKLLEERAVACGDEAALTFSSVETLYLLHCEAPRANLAECAQLLLGLHRNHLVEHKAVALAASEGRPGESVETVLRARIALKEVLALPIRTEGMLYSNLATHNISDAQLGQIADEILNETSSVEQRVAILMKNPMWRARVEKEYAVQITSMQDEVLAPAWEIVLEQGMDDETKKRKLTPYLIQINFDPENKTLHEIQTALKNAPTDFMRTKTQEILEPVALHSAHPEEKEHEVKEQEESS